MADADLHQPHDKLFKEGFSDPVQRRLALSCRSQSRHSAQPALSSR